MDFVAGVVGVLLLNYFGRRVIMLTFNTLHILALITFAFCELSTDQTEQAYGSTSLATYRIQFISFWLIIIFFQLSMGPIVWIYIPEILQDEALVLAVAAN